MMEKFIEVNNFSIDINQLLGYLVCRQNTKRTSSEYQIGSELLTCRNDHKAVFTAMEAVAFMHSLTLSKEQTRKVRQFLSKKDVYFPRTNELLPIRKSLRPETK